VLLAGDAEANEEEYIANGPYARSQTVHNVPKLHTLSEPRFRALLTEDGAHVLFHYKGYLTEPGALMRELRTFHRL
jgi:hypothetical protein